MNATEERKKEVEEAKLKQMREEKIKQDEIKRQLIVKKQIERRSSKLISMMAISPLGKYDK